MPNSDYAPQLATLVKAPPTGDEWLHEIKYDGYRIGCRIRGQRVSLLSRNGKDWTSAFPEVVEAARALGVDDTLLDGEVAIVLPDGRTSFQALQNAFAGQGSRASLVYFVFDALRLDGERIASLPLEARKARVHALLGDHPANRIRYAAHVDGSGEAFFHQACRAGLEGIISKRRDLPYQTGRHGGWVKTKCVLRQEFVIGGFTDPEGSRIGIGALLAGYYDDSRLVFSGKVGTGFTQKVSLDLRRRLERIEQKTCPFDPAIPGVLGRIAHWVKPELVAEVVFTEWTDEGKIRHPSFQGLRADKRARDVVREQPRATTPMAPPGPSGATTGTPRRRSRRVMENPPEAKADKRKGPKTSTRTAADGAPVIAGVRISHPDRLLYPDPPVTKLELAQYYETIADWIVPHVEGRPLTLVRCPQGITSDCFYMKHSKVWAPEPLRRVRIQEKTKLGEYLIADTIAAVVGLVQMDVLEIHTWNCVFETVERPNRIVIDLDPGERVTWIQVIDAARTVRKALDALDLESYVKTTGGRGVHVVVPLAPHADWSTCLDFSRSFSEAIEATDPQLYTTQFAKAGRAEKILIDYLRNNRTNTSIAAYSARARAHATVSVPITWEELRPSLAPESFTVQTLANRISKLTRDPWAGYWRCRQKLTTQRVKAMAAHRTSR